MKKFPTRNRQTILIALAVVALAGAFSACSILDNSGSSSSNVSSEPKLKYMRHEKKL